MSESSELSTLPAMWDPHFPKNEEEARAWKPLSFMHALDHRVLAVARTRVEGMWAGYIAAVPGQSHEAEMDDVLRFGTKLGERIARILFPVMDGVPYAH